jgi:hypothetical protein
MIYSKLFEKTQDNDDTTMNIQNAGKMILGYIIPYLKEFIAIIILLGGMRVYLYDTIVMGNPYLRNVLFFTHAFIIAIIMAGCLLKYFTIIKPMKNLYENLTTPTKENIPIKKERTFINIWKEVLEIHSFTDDLQNLVQKDIPNAPKNLATYIKTKYDKGKEIAKTGISNISNIMK